MPLKYTAQAESACPTLAGGQAAAVSSRRASAGSLTAA